MIMDLVEIEPVQMSFDYDSLDEPTRAFAKELDAEYDLFVERTLEGLGHILLKAKAGFSHGEFQSWYFSKGIRKTTAWRAMQAAQGKDLKSSNLELLPEEAIEQPVEPAEEVQEAQEVRINRTTKEEKRKTVEGFFTEFPQSQELSNREIARRCGVDEKLVRTIRKELFPEPEPLVESTVEQIEPEPEPEPEPEQLQEPEPTQTLVESTTYVDNIPIEVDNEPEPEPVAPNPVVEEKKSEPPVKSPALTALQSSESNEWYTPIRYINAAKELMGGIDLDPASCEQANELVKAADFYDISRNGLEESWKGRVWLNPPYGLTDGESNQAIWSQYLIEQIEEGNTKEAVLLVNANTEAKWFQPLYKYLICFTDHRIHFYNLDGEANQPTQGNALIYFGSKRELFIELFSRFGIVMERAK